MKVTFNNSSCIKEFNYDETFEILTVVFQNGGKYDYPDIPASLVHRWMKAESKGKFFNKEIRYYGRQTQ